MLPATAARFAFAGVFLLLGSANATAQESDQASPAEAWDTPEALALAELGRGARALAAAGLVDAPSWRSRALGYLHLILDRTDTGERSLIRVDQMAVDNHWMAEHGVRQQIAGWRNEEMLPVSVRYHLDHLTVVHDDLSGVMRFGDGDEVAGVPHPLAAGSGAAYEFRLGESLVLGLGATGDTLRVRELVARPRSVEEPGFVGSLHLDESDGSVVKMNYTFTPSSYVDPKLDYVRLSLENGYWVEYDGWLPRRQAVELRREPKSLDLLGGTIIRTEFEVESYEFGVEPPAATWDLPTVTAFPEAIRRSFPFTRGLFDGAGEGLAQPPALEDAWARATGAVLADRLRRVGPLRAHFRRISDVLRFNRVEGLFLGGGISKEAANGETLRLSLGHSFGRSAPSAELELTRELGESDLVVLAVWDDPADIGLEPGLDPSLNSLAVGLGWRDHLDLLLRRGASLSWSHRRSGFSLSAGAHEHATPLSDSRPVLAVSEGMQLRAEAGWTGGLASGLSAGVTGVIGRRNGHAFAKAGAAAEWKTDPGSVAEIVARIEGGAAAADAPLQDLFLIGGRGTVGGHPYRSVVGDRYWLLRTELTLPVRSPWVSLRLLAAAGGATTNSDRRLPPSWQHLESGRLLAGFGAGAALGWDLLRFDLMRGLDGSGWEFSLSLNPRFRAWS